MTAVRRVLASSVCGVTVGILAMLAGSCAGPAAPPRDMGAVCRVQACQCVEVNPGPLRARQTADIVWPERGPPGCPDGFRLQRAPSPR